MRILPNRLALDHHQRPRAFTVDVLPLQPLPSLTSPSSTTKRRVVDNERNKEDAKRQQREGVRVGQV